jgi:acylphosphatase
MSRIPKVQRRVFVSGRVQGVSFRASAAFEAQRLGELKGFARNLEDGRVEIVVAGEEPAVLKLVAWCRQGPARARVDKIEVIEEAVDQQLGSFEAESG